MGLFGNDNEQNARLDALEAHVRNLTETVQQNELGLVQLQVIMGALSSRIESKLSADDLDPNMVELSEQLSAARIEQENASKAANESWAAMQSGVQDAIGKLRVSAAEVAGKLESELRD